MEPERSNVPAFRRTHGARPALHWQTLLQTFRLSPACSVAQAFTATPRVPSRIPSTDSPSARFPPTQFRRCPLRCRAPSGRTTESERDCGSGFGSTPWWRLIVGGLIVPWSRWRCSLYRSIRYVCSNN